VKILDTLGREMTLKVTGRAAHRDFIHTPKAGGGETIKAASYDPLFTMIDMTIDPEYYFDKPAIGINYLPLRRALLEKQFPGDEDAVGRWVKLGQVAPMTLNAHGAIVAREHMNDADAEPYREALGQADRAMGLFADLSANFLMVAPPARDQSWTHVSQLDEASPVRAAMLEMGKAWRERNAAGVNAATRTLATLLPAINAETYPTSRRGLELSYNKANAFEWGFWLYGISLVLLVLAFGTGRSWLAWSGGIVLGLAFVLHAFGFAARCLIAERFAIQNQFESMTGLSLFAVVVGVAIMLVRRQWLFGAAAAGVGFLVLITATQARIPGVSIEREAAILNTSVLLKYHVTTVLSSYGLIALGFVVSLFYLGTYYAHRLRGLRTPAALDTGASMGGDATLPSSMAGHHHAHTDDTSEGDGLALALGRDVDDQGRASIGARARTLADLDTAQLVLLQLAFWTLGVGILLGAWWADHSWGRWWAFDPKETWALITWIVYLIVIHVRIAAPANKGLTTAWLSVIGFFVMLWTYFGVNLLLPGLHAYA
jgi:cytochrome c-type biogenesis protein CcsB